ncbi:universal stress protein [Oceanimonas doudoroffii]|uniref:UspA domain-containing protein n=1 Tax=Oceanimonas doudoroffii TaxID=84158 RepID=A0A233RD27_9GAMM|nr:universal stress protein [Oceanimonas doudoroffii]OXY81294.1 hypothetical protein B6S08_12430 [Oceanimonas doudoroffii]
MKELQPAFRHLLVALDDSPDAEAALDMAASLAKSHGCRLTLISVYRHFSYTNSRYTQIRVGPIEDASPVELSLKSFAEEVLERSRSRLAQQGLQAESLLRRGTPAMVIMEQAEQLEVDAIVIGSRPKGDMQGRLLGSIADKISAQAHCSCLRVRRPAMTSG